MTMLHGHTIITTRHTIVFSSITVEHPNIRISLHHRLGVRHVGRSPFKTLFIGAERKRMICCFKAIFWHRPCSGASPAIITLSKNVAITAYNRGEIANKCRAADEYAEICHSAEARDRLSLADIAMLDIRNVENKTTIARKFIIISIGY